MEYWVVGVRAFGGKVGSLTAFAGDYAAARRFYDAQMTATGGRACIWDLCRPGRAGKK